MNAELAQSPRNLRHYLFAILLIAAFVRIVRLDTLPPALFRDEAEKVYNAWSILRTGRDVEGNLFPGFIRVFGVTTSATYQYAAIPFIVALGLNEWSARLPAACAGVATIALLYSLVRRERGQLIALWAAMLLSVSPWHVPLSRWAQQGIFLPLFLTGAALCFRLFLHHAPLRKGLMALPAAAALAALAFYSYDIGRLFVPLLALVYGIVYWSDLRRHWKSTLVSCGVFLLIAGPSLYLMLFQQQTAQARFRHLSIFQPGVSTSQAIMQFCLNYVSHFSPAFLLIHGDAELRHSGGVGMLNPLECVTLVAGFFAMLLRRKREDVVWLFWLLLAPVASSLTRQGVPHALRAIVMLPAVTVIAACGIERIIELIPRARQAMGRNIALLAVIGGSSIFLISYFGNYASRSAFNWQYGVKQALAIVDKPPLRSARVYLHNIVGAEYLIPCYRNIDPASKAALSNMKRRFVMLPFQAPHRNPPFIKDQPAAYITPPGYAWPPHWTTIPIRYANDEKADAETLVILDPKAAALVGRTVK